MADKLRSFTGPNHIFYAMIAALVGAVASAYGIIAHLPAETIARMNMAFLMFYLGGIVSGFSYGSHGLADENRLARCYWQFGKWPYLVTALMGLVHLFAYNEVTAMLLQLSALAAILALLPSLWVMTRTAP